MQPFPLIEHLGLLGDHRPRCGRPDAASRAGEAPRDELRRRGRRAGDGHGASHPIETRRSDEVTCSFVSSQLTTRKFSLRVRFICTRAESGAKGSRKGSKTRAPRCRLRSRCVLWPGRAQPASSRLPPGGEPPGGGVFSHLFLAPQISGDALSLAGPRTPSTHPRVRPSPRVR
jgi:hypothetical protein